MDLFHQDITQNLLPFDGIAEYYGPVLSTEDSQANFHALLSTVPWEHDQAVVFGKRYVTKRKVAWYGDTNFQYTYSRISKRAILWTPELMALKDLVEKLTGATYNSCLLNLYHDGSEGMGWHSDAEKTLQENGAIASISLGAERKFSFKHKASKQRVDIVLQNGSLLLMKGTLQKHWLHRLPPTKKVQAPRINLTFRTIID